jgi:hypothetical protein
MISISLTNAVGIVIVVIIGAIIFGLLMYLASKAPFIPPDWKPAINWLIIALAVVILIGILLSITGQVVFRP